jgi:hypothetical protein
MDNRGFETLVSGRGLAMGRKVTGRVVNVKITSELAAKAKLISADRGIPVAEYVCEALEAALRRDWPKTFKKLAEQAGGDQK